jgi:NADH-quinone oxidoreductase subunit C
MSADSRLQEQVPPIEIMRLANELVGELSQEIYLEDRGNLLIRLEPANLVKLVIALRDDPRLSYRYLVYITAIDYEDQMEAAYMLRSMKHGVPAELRAPVDREDPHLQSLSLLFSTACWHERETYDLLGVRFDGHPELTRILTGRKEEIFPLRKDARPHRQPRDEWSHKGLAEALRLPGERDRNERS